MDLFEWFSERLGRRVHLDVLGLASQSWIVYMISRECVVLGHPSDTPMVEEVRVYFKGITRFADPGNATEPGEIIGMVWDPTRKRWIPLTLAEFQGETPPSIRKGADVPDHLPGDVGFAARHRGADG